MKFNLCLVKLHLLLLEQLPVNVFSSLATRQFVLAL